MELHLARPDTHIRNKQSKVYSPRSICKATAGGSSEQELILTEKEPRIPEKEPRIPEGISQTLDIRNLPPTQENPATVSVRMDKYIPGWVY